MARALTLEPFLAKEFDVAGVARMLLEDLSGAVPAHAPTAEAAAPAEPEIDPDSPDYKAGFEAGRAEAAEEAAAELAAAIARADAAEARVAALEPQLAGVLAAMEQTRRGAERRMAEESAAILGAAFEALLPEFARRGFAAEAGASVREWLSRAASAEGVLYVPEGFEAELGAAVAAASGEDANVRVSADAALAPGAARFEWRDGLGELDLNESAARIRAAFDAHLERLGLAEAVAARALTPPTAPEAPAAASDVTEPDVAPSEEATASSAETAAPAKKKSPRKSAKAPARSRATPSTGAETDGETPKKGAAKGRGAAKTRESGPAAEEDETSADAAPEKPVKKAPSRRRTTGGAKSATTTSGESND